MEINNSWQTIRSTCFWSLSFCFDSCSFPVSCSYSYSSLWIYSYSHLYPLLLRLFCRDVPSKEPELLVVSPPRSQSLPSVWPEESPGRTKSSNLSAEVLFFFLQENGTSSSLVGLSSSLESLMLDPLKPKDLFAASFNHRQSSDSVKG